MAECGPTLGTHASARGHRLHVWDRAARRHLSVLDLGAPHQTAPVLCAAHDPSRSYGFAGVSLNVIDLSSSIWLWDRAHEGADGWRVEPVIHLSAAGADEVELPPMLRQRGRIPPLVTSLCLSLDDRWLHVACWGSGEVRRYDVTDPRAPRLGGLGAPDGREGAPARSGGPPPSSCLATEAAYVTNGFHAGWTERFYAAGTPGWMVKLDLHPDGGMCVDSRFSPALEQWRPQQVRLEGGDASSDVFCYA